MNSEQKKQCHFIIHSSAIAAAAGNANPIPGLGLSADAIAITSMAVRLAKVFGRSLPEGVARGLAMSALKRALVNQPVKAVTKELFKFIPFLGSVAGPALSISIIEEAGWSLAYQMDRG